MTDENTSNNITPDTTASQEEVMTKQENPQAQEATPKTYTEKEFKDAMAAVKSRAEDKVLRKFEGVDVARYNDLIAKEEQAKLAEQKRKGEFEKILQEQSAKANEKINTLTSELTRIKVDQALLNSASTNKAINPEQVVQLVRNQVKMSDTGQVEVINESGQTRYDDQGQPLTPQDLVNEFLQKNPHFQQAGPAGGGSTSNTKSESPADVDLNKLDPNNPEHRKVFRELQAKNASTPKFF
tara:strand:+ start:141 stop:860 length:720 start_codon:yes stop_codon:yes gene_type:complete